MLWLVGICGSIYSQQITLSVDFETVTHKIEDCVDTVSNEFSVFSDEISHLVQCQICQSHSLVVHLLEGISKGLCVAVRSYQFGKVHVGAVAHDQSDFVSGSEGHVRGSSQWSQSGFDFLDFVLGKNLRETTHFKVLARVAYCKKEFQNPKGSYTASVLTDWQNTCYCVPS